MQTPYIINCQTVTEDSSRDGDYNDCFEQESGTATVKDIIRDAVNTYGIRSLPVRVVCNWFASTSPQQDRDFFEKGIEKYYTLHFPLLSPRALRRVNQMFQILWKEQTECMK